MAREIGRLPHVGLGTPRQDGAQRMMKLIQSLNYVWEGTLTAGVSPLVLNFNAAKGWNAIQGWMTCDTESMLVEFSRDGIDYGGQWTMLQGENTNFDGIDIFSLRLTHTGADAEYRVWLI